MARNVSRRRAFVVRDDDPATVENAFMVAMIRLACLTAVTLFETGSSTLFSNTTPLSVR